MNRFNLLLSLFVTAIFVLLMFFAGQPITSEADLVQRWYDTFCNPAVNQSLLYIYTWHGDQSNSQFQTTVDAYRAANNYAQGCTAVVNHNIIYFESIPSELAATVDRIKFVAVNVYAPGEEQDRNHILSIRTSVHVVFYKNGIVKILPHFIPDSLLGLQPNATAVALHNNDGLLMGQIEINGSLIQIQQSDSLLVGIPLRFSGVRRWDSAWIRIYADGVEVAPVNYADALPEDQRTTFLSEFPESLDANLALQGVVWFSAPHMPADLRLSIDVNQTRWDMPGIPIMIKVK